MKKNVSSILNRTDRPTDMNTMDSALKCVYYFLIYKHSTQAWP
jgi:hypothetical protein